MIAVRGSFRPEEVQETTFVGFGRNRHFIGGDSFGPPWLLDRAAAAAKNR